MRTPAPAYHFWVFLGGLLLLWWGLGYPALWDVPPSGVHLWRQADGASLAYQYAQQGRHFWQPQLHQLFEGSPRTVGEFPIWYYLASFFGSTGHPPENALRLLHLLLFGAGLWALSRLTWRYTQDSWWALLLPGLVSTSPVVAYYAFNFLPNVPALGLALVGLCGMLGYLDTQRRGYLAVGIIGFLLAGLTKLPAVVPLLALLLAWAVQRYRRQGPWPRGKVFLLAVLGIAGLLLAWNGYMSYYKAIHRNTYFLAKAKPIWETSLAHVLDTFRRIRLLWWPDYGHVTLHLLTVGGFGLATWRLVRKELRYFLLFLLLGTGAVFLLFFQQFHHHDYYYVDLYPLVIACLLLGACSLPVVWRSHPLACILLVIILLVNVYHARRIIAFRSAPHSKYMVGFNYDLHHPELPAFLEGLGVAPDAPVLSFPDGSPNNTLYFLNRPGWTQFRTGPITPEKVQKRIDQGARYLVLTDAAWRDKPALQSFLTRPLGDFRGSIFVYKIGGLPGEE